jgi:transcriptional regulator with XRE-family HTH domain
MTRRPPDIRKLRKSARLTQRELAHLVGLQSQGVFSEIETGRKRPNLAIVLALAVVFDRPVAEIFPQLRAQAERLVLTAARELDNDSDLHPAAQSFVAALIARLGDKPTQP